MGENQLDEGTIPSVEGAELEAKQIAADENEPTSGAEPTEEGEGGEKPKELDPVERVKKGMQKRIDRLTRDRMAEKARADYLEKLIAERQSSQEERGLDRSKFASDEDWLEAEVSRRLNAVEAQKAEIAQQEQMLTREARREQILMDAELSGQFDRDKFFKAVPVTDAMADAVLESDVGTDLVLWLNSNPAEAIRIANLSPIRQAVELGKIEVQLSSPDAKPAPSKAPAPPKTVTGGGKVSSGYRTDMSLSEYARWRKANK